MVAVGASAILIPLALTHGKSGASPSPSAIADITASPDLTTGPSARPTATAADTPEATPTDTPTDGPTPASTAGALTAKGFPVKWQVPTSLIGVGPDGTSYFSDGIDWHIVDSSGHEKARPQSDPGDGGPTNVAEDGTLYALISAPDGGSSVAAWNADGSLRYHSEPGDYDWIVDGPEGRLYTFGGGGLTVFDHNGSVVSRANMNPGSKCDTRSGWSVSATGGAALMCEPAIGLDQSGALIASLGGLNSDTPVEFSLDDGESLGNIAIFDSKGHFVGFSPDQWNGFAFTPSGSIIALRFKFAGQERMDPITETTVALLDSKGKVAPGWPVKFEAAASLPTTAPDGTIYMAVGSEETSSGRILALGRDGKAKSGWPITLPVGTWPRGAQGTVAHYYPASPVLAWNGSVLEVVQHANKADAIVGFGPDGSQLAGWPVTLPGNVTPLFVGQCIDWGCPTYSPPLFVAKPDGALLYVHVGQSILAIQQNGDVAKGWPKAALTIAGHSDVYFNFTFWKAMPDGGLITVQETDDESYDFPMYRWRPDGSLYK